MTTNKRTIRILAFALTLVMLAGCFIIGTFASGEVEPIDFLEDYVIYSEYRQNDGTIGIPVGICTYMKDAKANTNTDETIVMFYAMNYNGEGTNLSNEADEPIINDLLDSGYIVITLDYYNNPLAKSPIVSHSIQNIRANNIDALVAGYSYNASLKKLMVSGYRHAANLVYFTLNGNAPKGMEEATVFSAWNSTEFQAKLAKYMTPYKATSFDQCVNKDGTPVDTNLYVDVFYPSRPITNDVPVLISADSADIRGEMTAGYVDRPIDGEIMTRGYAFAAYDHCYYPMARGDHYGYFNPYGMQSQLGIQTHTAAIRCIRYFSYLFGYGTDSYGGFGHSKTSLIASLANPHPEDLPENSAFTKSYTLDGVTYDAYYYRNERYGDHPYLAYKDTAEEIPSNIQFCYSSMGLGVEMHNQIHNVSTAPMFTASGIRDQYEQWAFWFEQIDTFNTSGSDFMAFSFLDKGHVYVYGTNAVYGFDEFDLTFDYIDYYMKDNIAPRVGYLTIDPLAEVTPIAGVTVQFSGRMTETSIKNGVIITDTTDNVEIPFTVRAEGNGSKWTFYAKDNFTVGHSYTIEISDAVKAANGMPIEASHTKSFKCVAEPSVIADSSRLQSNYFYYYTPVGIQFSAPIDEKTMKENCTIVDNTTGETLKPMYEFMDDSRLWTIAPSLSKNKWTAGHSYTVTIGKNVCGADGTPLGEDYVIKFTIRG